MARSSDNHVEPLGIFIPRSRFGCQPISSSAGLRLQLQQLCGRVVEHAGFFVIAQEAAAKDMVHGVQLPLLGIVADHDDLACADLGNEVPNGLEREDERVEIELLEVFARLLLQDDIGIAARG